MQDMQVGNKRARLDGFYLLGINVRLTNIVDRIAP